MIVRIVEQ